MPKPVLYHENSLQIIIPAGMPAVTHHQLLRACMSVMPLVATHPEATPEDRAQLHPLSQLACSLLPDELALQKATGD